MVAEQHGSTEQVGQGADSAVGRVQERRWRSTCSRAHHHQRGAREFVVEVGTGLAGVRNGILVSMDKNLVPSASTQKSKIFQFKMKGDDYRHFVEFATGDAKKKVAEGAREAYAETTKIAEKDLVVTHPIYLDLALNFSVLQYEVFGTRTMRATPLQNAQ